MRTLIAVGMIALATAVVAPPVLAIPDAQSQAAPGQPQGPGANPSGVLGPVDALGQEVTRAPAPTGPAARLPDGTIDLGDGIWVSAPFTPASGFRLGEELLLPYCQGVHGIAPAHR